MMKSCNHILAAVSMLLVIAAASCRSGRQASSQQYPHEQQELPGVEQSYEALAASYFDWTDVEMPVKLELRQPSRISVSGKASMVNGRCVSVSIRILGMEVASLYADNDSVYVVVKANRMAYSESMSRFTAATGLGIADIQSMLLGRAFIPGSGTIAAGSVSSFSLRTENSGEQTDGSLHWYMSPRCQADDFSWSFSAVSPAITDSGQVPSLTGLDVELPAGRSISCAFSDNTMTTAGAVAAKVNIDARVMDKPVEVDITWSPSRGKWNTGLSPAPPGIRDGYRRISTAELIRIIKNFAR